MPAQLVPPELLKKSDKILFIAHLALGDFTYLQNCFKAFAEAYPHIQIHIWVDEVRRTSQQAKWEHLRKYALYDWLAACPFVTRIYRDTYSPALYKQSIRTAQQQQYPLVVSLSTLRPPLYAALAREISPHGFVAGMRQRTGFLALHRRLAYRKLNVSLDIDAMSLPGQHISAVYAGWFHRLFGVDIPASARFPFVQIPALWNEYAARQLTDWQFDAASRGPGKLLFINPFAKTGKRCWPLERVVELVLALKKRTGWSDSCFVVNVVPEEMANAKQFFKAHALDRVQLFSAQDNFFQLPAILGKCDLVISVETAVMHLANAVRIPVIALMRQKNPEWAPIDKEHSTVITTANRREWVRSITVVQVLAALPETIESNHAHR
jgi:ADP-heptose:LPS heptosyltransferase